MFDSNLDPEDNEILKKRLTALNENPGPRVGDFVFMKGEDKPRRFTYDWGEGIQTTDYGAGGSFYLGDGYVSFSGGLSPSIDKKALLNSGQTRLGRVWFFHHNYACADNGVETEIPFRVFVQNG